MVQKKPRSQSATEKPVTLRELGKFTDEVILPGVERIVDGKLDEKLSPLREEMRAGFAEMRQGFKDVHGSIQVLAGEIAELKEQGDDHEQRIRRLEEKVGIRAKA